MKNGLRLPENLPLVASLSLCYNKLTISPSTEVTTTMRHRMHDGPAPDSDDALMISRWQSTVSTVKPTPRATLAALSWAADKAGMSYGRFLQTLGPAYAPHIQQEYETDEGMKPSYAREAQRLRQGDVCATTCLSRADS